TTGVPRADTTGRSGKTRCGRTWDGSSNRSVVADSISGNHENTKTRRRQGRCTDRSQPESIQQISASLDHRLIVDPHIAVAREDVDVRPRRPRGVRLVPVRVAEREVHARYLLVLQQ